MVDEAPSVLVLPDNYQLPSELKLGPRAHSTRAEADARGLTPLRIGIINVMPKAEEYEPFLLRPLAHAPVAVEPVWLRLESHGYASSDVGHIARHYQAFGDAHASRPLSGLILTGAPVEELEFEAVHYWRELSLILRFAAKNLPGTLGICWGGLALAQLLELEKTSFPKKLFGVYANRNLDPEHPITGQLDDEFFCAHSRHSGIRDRTLEDAATSGKVRLLSHGTETGYTVFESSDRRFLMHLGHPEYEAWRLAMEWKRDRALGRTDVAAPHNFDPERPRNVWRSHCNELFTEWLNFLGGSQPRAHSLSPSESRAD